MALWTWIPDFDIANEAVVQSDLPSEGDEYGAREVDFLTAPLERAQFQAEGLTLAEVIVIRTAAKTRPPAYTATTHVGSFVGFIEQFKATQIAGTLYFSASMSLYVEDSPFE